MRKLQRAVIKEEYFELTGDAVKSLILNQFVFWTEIAHDMDKETIEKIAAFEKMGATAKADKLRKELRKGWFYKSAREMTEEIIIGKRATVDRKMDELSKLAFISVKTPEEMGKTSYERANRSNWYKVDLKLLQQELFKHGYNLDGYALEDSAETAQQRIAQNEQSGEMAQQRIAQNEQSTAQIEQSTAQNEQSYSKLLQKESFNTPFVSNYVSAGADIIFNLYQSNYNLTKYAKNSLRTFIEKHSEDLVSLAIERSVSGEADKPIAYINGTLEKWAKNNCKTVEDVLKYEDNHRKQQKENKQNNSNTPKQPKKRNFTRVEMVPEWLNKNKEAATAEPKKESNSKYDDFEAEKARLEAELKKYNKAVLTN